MGGGGGGGGEGQCVQLMKLKMWKKAKQVYENQLVVQSGLSLS